MSTKPMWLCYISGVRACGPVQVVHHNRRYHYTSGDDMIDVWRPADDAIDDADVVSSARRGQLPEDAWDGKEGQYANEYGCTILITSNLSKATSFIDGARAARRAVAKSMYERDTGPATPMRAKGPVTEVPDDDAARRFADDDEGDD